MAKVKGDGNCYLCGKTLGKTAMKNHILKEHSSGDEECVLLEVEGAYANGYWILIDLPMNKTLDAVDKFLRRIWLECCGHLSKFDGAAKTRKLSALTKGDQFVHEYDMGTTTECVITVVGETLRPKQGKRGDTVRLLARNIAPVFECEGCGKPAKHICQICMYDSDNPFYCEECAKKHEHEEMLPITNSPRNGECGYDGEFDDLAFDPANVKESGKVKE